MDSILVIKYIILFGSVVIGLVFVNMTSTEDIELELLLFNTSNVLCALYIPRFSAIAPYVHTCAHNFFSHFEIVCVLLCRGRR